MLYTLINNIILHSQEPLIKQLEVKYGINTIKVCIPTCKYNCKPPMDINDYNKEEPCRFNEETSDIKGLIQHM
jgi:hypothetical protein